MVNDLAGASSSGSSGSIVPVTHTATGNAIFSVPADALSIGEVIAGARGFVAVRQLGVVKLDRTLNAVVQLPSDTFRYSHEAEGYGVTATLNNGWALPSWISWHAATRSLVVLEQQVPAGLEMEIRFTARDSNGRSVSTNLRLRFG